MRVLIAMADERDFHLFAAMLIGRSHLVTKTSDLGEGLELIVQSRQEEELLAVLVVDYSLQGHYLDRRQFIQAAKTNGVERIIVVSKDDHENEAINDGADMFLRMSFKPDDLRDAVENCFHVVR